MHRWHKALFVAVGIVVASVPICAQAQDSQQTDPYRVDNSAKLQAKATLVFNGYIRRLGMKARVSSCANLLSAHLGSVEDVFVGQCRLTTGQQVTLCGDIGVGEFGLNLYLYAPNMPSKADLEAFSKLNCPGG